MDFGVGEIWLLGGGTPTDIFLNADLVANGLARPDKQYRDNYPNRMVLETAEEMATQLGSGIWLDAENIAPWDWRRKKLIFLKNYKKSSIFVIIKYCC